MVLQMKLFKIQYNKRSAKKLGWRPEWFGSDKFDSQLIENIELFQVSGGLKSDGLVGPETYRRICTLRDSKSDPGSSIICNSVPVPVDGEKVKLDLIKPGCYKEQKTERAPTMIVTHWDACLSAEACKRVLEKRGISTHFVIDNDGTIVQLLDCNHVAWHAGNRRVNSRSIGIDLSNAFYPRYQGTYKKRGFGARPILSSSEVHGVKLDSHLGYYPAQIKAYSALIDTLADHYDIDLACPLDESGNLLTKVHSKASRGKFNGIVCHYHLTRKKIDAAGLKLDEILRDIRYGRTFED